MKVFFKCLTHFNIHKSYNPKWKDSNTMEHLIVTLKYSFFLCIQVVPFYCPKVWLYSDNTKVQAKSADIDQLV